MPLERVLKNFPYGIESCDGSMFVGDGDVYYIYKDKKWVRPNYGWTGYFDVITDVPTVELKYNEVSCMYEMTYLNRMLDELLIKEMEVLTTKMMIFDDSNGARSLPELSLMIAGMCFELGVM
jgi:hypothetical protein